MTPLAKKLKLKESVRIAVVGAPLGYVELLEPLPEGATLLEKIDGDLDWIQIFTPDMATLAQLGSAAKKALAPAGLLWISFPKGSSGMQTDLTRDRGWEAFDDRGLKWLTLVSVDEKWSAFGFRPLRPGETERSWRR